MTYLPLMAALVSLVFTYIVGRDWMRRRRPYKLLWAASLFLYAIAAYGEFSSLAFGWTPIMYKLYFFCAMTLVAFMGVGELHLLFRSGSRVPWTVTLVTLVLTILFAVQLANAPVVLKLLHRETVTIGGAALPPIITDLYGILFSAVGGLILIVGSLISWWRWRTSSALFIAAGACVLSLAGTAAKMGNPLYLPASELIGICLLFWGFVRANRRTEVQNVKAQGAEG